MYSERLHTQNYRGVVYCELGGVMKMQHNFMGMRRIYASAQEGKDMMEYELTPEKVMEIGKG